MGKRAVIGSNAMCKALDEMMPNQFVLVSVEHSSIEAILVRTAHLRRGTPSLSPDSFDRCAWGYRRPSEVRSTSTT